jgi:hypothetical protein
MSDVHNSNPQQRRKVSMTDAHDPRVVPPAETGEFGSRKVRKYYVVDAAALRLSLIGEEFSTAASATAAAEAESAPVVVVQVFDEVVTLTETVVRKVRQDFNPHAGPLTL